MNTAREYLECKKTSQSSWMAIMPIGVMTSNTLQVILLSTSPCVLVEMPLDIALLIIQCARANLK